jgi:hypothetical protein
MQDKLVAESVFHPFVQVARRLVNRQAWLDALVDQDMAQRFGNLSPGDEKAGVPILIRRELTAWIPQNKRG